MLRLLIPTILLMGSVHADELSVEKEAAMWVEQLMKKRECGCFEEEQVPGIESFYVFMSFSVPDDVWIALSIELVKLGGSFVLRGLPENSFEKFAQRIASLRKKGVEAPIHIDPRLFETFTVTAVPCIAMKEDRWSKLSGAVSLDYACRLFAGREL